MSPVGRLVFNTSEVLYRCLVGSTPTSSANFVYFPVAPDCREVERANMGQPFGNFFEEVSIYCSASIELAAYSLEALINELYLAYISRVRHIMYSSTQFTLLVTLDVNQEAHSDYFKPFNT